MTTDSVAVAGGDTSHRLLQTKAMTDEADQVLGEVVLLDIPLELRDRAQQHSDELVREMALVALQIGEGEGRDLPVRLTQLVAEVQATFGAFSARPDAELDAASARGDATAQIVYHVPVSAGPFTRHLIDILEETDEFCRQGTYLLALASPPDIHAYRIWALREFERQLAGEAPTPWPEYAQEQGVALTG